MKRVEATQVRLCALNGGFHTENHGFPCKSEGLSAKSVGLCRRKSGRRPNGTVRYYVLEMMDVSLNMTDLH